MKLHRYWIVFSPPTNSPYQTEFSYGVTAFDLPDALQIIHDNFFPQREMPEITYFIEDVDISKLNNGNLLPNLGVPVWRGLWYPDVGGLH